MHISVVICTRNRPDLIAGAVSSVLACHHPSFDVQVVDQSDDLQTRDIVEELAAHHDNLRCYHTSIPGLSRAYNIGVRESTGELLAFTDDDCIVPTDWLEAIDAAFEAEPVADLLYGQVLLPAALEHSAGLVPTLPIPTSKRLSRSDGFQIYGMGANFAARRRLFEHIGGFDEVLGGGGPLRSSQDFDFQYRAYVAGATTLLRPEVRVDHYGLRSTGQWPATMVAYGVGDGAFYSKHVRCGDLFAFRLLVARVGRIGLREALLRLGVIRRGSQAKYLQGFLDGVRQGLTYSIDRQRRLYVNHSPLAGSAA